MSAEREYWFPTKRYGWGWGIPTTWQGWLVLAAFVVLLIIGSIVLPPGKQILVLLGLRGRALRAADWHLLAQRRTAALAVGQRLVRVRARQCDQKPATKLMRVLVAAIHQDHDTELLSRDEPNIGRQF